MNWWQFTKNRKKNGSRSKKLLNIIDNWRFFSTILDTDLATWDSWPWISSLHCLTLWNRKLLSFFNGGKPEAEFVGKEVASSSSTVTFDEWSCSEIFQTRARWTQWLTTAFSTSASVHGKRVANPQRAPSSWTVWNLNWLRMNRNNIGWSFAYATSADVWLNFAFWYGHHRKCCASSQPIRLVVSRGIVANVIEVTEEEWHCAESW